MYVPNYAAAILLPVLLLTPLFASAQSAGTTGNYYYNNYYSSVYSTTTGAWSQYGDGSTEASTTRQQRIRGIRNSSEMQQKIAALGSVVVTAVPMPILFGVMLSNMYPNFGDPRDGGARTHEGEDIMGVKGTPVVSPTPAVVLRVVTGSSEGNTVYTANPGGETFVYMHLDTFAEGLVQGSVLPQGGLIGYVGNTGNASGGAAHLHFEIHDASGQPVNPYPRITIELPVQQKITYLNTILAQNSNPSVLSQLLVDNFRSTFTEALAAGIALPQIIINTLAATPAVAVRTTNSASALLPTGDLDVGSTGAEVVALQTYLIQAASGPASTRLAQAGATGTFGPMTAAALAEYQTRVGIAPASGYYGPLTRAYVAGHAIGALAAVQTPTPSTAPAVSAGNASTLEALIRDLKQGMSGEDVRTLQKLLNSSGFVVAASGAGSAGEETVYFGPATQQAVIAYQKAHSISPAVGYVGPLTRAAMGF